MLSSPLLLPTSAQGSARLTSAMPPSDPELVARLRGQDEAALAELYDRHAPACYGLALRVLGDEQAAGSVVQDAFLLLWERPERFDAGRAELRAYLLTVVRSRALDRLRREKPALPLYDEAGEEFPLEDPGAGPHARAEDAWLAEQVRGALASLSDAQRETVERAFFEDQSREEIAQAMGVPVGTVKSRLKYALDKLRVVLSPGWSRVAGGEE